MADEEEKAPHWNYRIIEHKGEFETVLGLHEVYYNIRGDLSSYTEDPIIVGDTKEEVLNVLARMKKGIEDQEKILTPDDFGKGPF